MNEKSVVNNGLSIIENYNDLFTQITRAKDASDISHLRARVKDFATIYENVDSKMVDNINAMFLQKMKDMISENEDLFERLKKKMDGIQNRMFEFDGKMNDSQAVQYRVSQLMVQLPKTMNDANVNHISNVLESSIKSGIVGSKAVLELLKYPAYANMVSERIKELAFQGSKSVEELAFDKVKEAEIEKTRKSLASTFNQGFQLRIILKRFKKEIAPSVWA